MDRTKTGIKCPGHNHGFSKKTLKGRKNRALFLERSLLPYPHGQDKLTNQQQWEEEEGGEVTISDYKAMPLT